VVVVVVVVVVVAKVAVVVAVVVDGDDGGCIDTWLHTPPQTSLLHSICPYDEFTKRGPA
jgi:hypothetical protein